MTVIKGVSRRPGGSRDGLSSLPPRQQDFHFSRVFMGIRLRRLLIPRFVTSTKIPSVNTRYVTGNLTTYLIKRAYTSLLLHITSRALVFVQDPTFCCLNVHTKQCTWGGCLNSCSARVSCWTRSFLYGEKSGDGGGSSPAFTASHLHHHQHHHYHRVIDHQRYQSPFQTPHRRWL